MSLQISNIGDLSREFCSRPSLVEDVFGHQAS
jgi:hypothetical protein